MGAPSLPTSLQPAAWRYIPFEAREVGREAGRRLVVHEYPQRDQPSFDDMGRKTRRWKIQGFVLGELAPAIRDRMIAACEKEGPGPLMHPTLGLVQARCDSLSVRESVSQGTNVVEFGFDFVEAGAIYTSGIIQTVVAVAKAAAVTTASAIAYVASHRFAGHQPQDVRTRAVVDQASRADSMAGLSGKFTDRANAEVFKVAVDAIAVDSAAIASDSAAAVAAWQNAFVAVTSPVDLRAIASSLLPMFERSQAAAVAGPSSGTSATITANTAALDLLLYPSALAQAVAAATSETFTTWDDAVAVRDLLASYVDVACLWTSDADLYSALLDLKGTMVGAISDEAVALPRLRPLVVPRPRPALVLAFDLYGDATRAAEIVTRNGLSDPSAVAGEVRVLTA